MGEPVTSAAETAALRVRLGPSADGHVLVFRCGPLRVDCGPFHRSALAGFARWLEDPHRSLTTNLCRDDDWNEYFGLHSAEGGIALAWHGGGPVIDLACTPKDLAKLAAEIRQQLKELS